jgi:hypothetical protein
MLTNSFTCTDRDAMKRLNASMTSRAQRLVEEFNEGLAAGGRTEHGIAQVLRHLAAAFGEPDEDDFWYIVAVDTLEELSAELTAPTLLERGLAGDPEAARQFLLDAGIITADGELAPPYRTPEG